MHFFEACIAFYALLPMLPAGTISHLKMSGKKFFAVSFA